jgi:hypothetical protein
MLRALSSLDVKPLLVEAYPLAWNCKKIGTDDRSNLVEIDA